MQQQQVQLPQEVLSSILVYAGPCSRRTATTLNSNWKRAAQHEATFQALSQALGKSNPQTSPPSSWRTFYEENILVPEECPTLQQALQFASYHFQQASKAGIPGKRITIWLKPATVYSLEETLSVNLVGKLACLCIATRKEHNTDIDTMDIVPEEEEEGRDFVMTLDDDHNGSSSSTDSCRPSRPPSSTTATLIMETKKCNQPLLRLEQGTLELRDLSVEHFSEVHLMQLMAHKNENAAILLQGVSAEAELSLSLDSVSVRSYSGKGILNRHGGQVGLSGSFVARMW